MNPIDHPIVLLCAGLIALNAWQWVRRRKADRTGNGVIVVCGTPATEDLAFPTEFAEKITRLYADHPNKQ